MLGKYMYNFICKKRKAFTQTAVFSGNIVIFESNIQTDYFNSLEEMSVDSRSVLSTIFFYIQISCWVYRPELQWQFRLFCTQ